MAEYVGEVAEFKGSGMGWTNSVAIRCLPLTQRNSRMNGMLAPNLGAEFR